MKAWEGFLEEVSLRLKIRGQGGGKRWGGHCEFEEGYKERLAQGRLTGLERFTLISAALRGGLSTSQLI